MNFFSGKRPFGVSLLYMGWDKHYGFQLYQSDPSGNYGGWKGTCIGNNSAVSFQIVSSVVVTLSKEGLYLKSQMILINKCNPKSNGFCIRTISTPHAYY